MLSEVNKIKKKRAYVSDTEKEKISNSVPQDLTEDIIGSLLGDGTLRYNGKMSY